MTETNVQNKNNSVVANDSTNDVDVSQGVVVPQSPVSVPVVTAKAVKRPNPKPQVSANPTFSRDITYFSCSFLATQEN